ncbi:sugar phosphate nucleotidyltransferase [Dyella sp. KULCS107]|uniref:sugar phosphate nucleotidyltransferase n=1 Tax=Dyella sp. KULCS107 TaxID=3422216 RepID=UPI003D6EC877
MARAEEAIVLVGGLGTRLRGVIPDLPKPLAPVAGRPFLAYLLDQLAAGGLRRIILATGYMAEKIEQTIGLHWGGAEIVYSRESEPLGTGGAIRLAAAMVQGEGVHLANGDTFLRFSPADLECRVRELGVAFGVALAKVADVGRYGAVGTHEGRVVTFQEKGGHGPGLINAGSYFLTASALNALPAIGAYSFESEVLVPASRAGNLAYIDETRDFIDIGVPEDFARAQQLFAA